MLSPELLSRSPRSEEEKNNLAEDEEVSPPVSADPEAAAATGPTEALSVDEDQRGLDKLQDLHSKIENARTEAERQENLWLDADASDDSDVGTSHYGLLKSLQKYIENMQEEYNELDAKIQRRSRLSEDDRRLDDLQDLSQGLYGYYKSHVIRAGAASEMTEEFEEFSDEIQKRLFRMQTLVKPGRSAVPRFGSFTWNKEDDSVFVNAGDLAAWGVFRKDLTGHPFTAEMLNFFWKNTEVRAFKQKNTDPVDNMDEYLDLACLLKHQYLVPARNNKGNLVFGKEIPAGLGGPAGPSETMFSPGSAQLTDFETTWVKIPNDASFYKKSDESRQHDAVWSYSKFPAVLKPLFSKYMNQLFKSPGGPCHPNTVDEGKSSEVFNSPKERARRLAAPDEVSSETVVHPLPPTKKYPPVEVALQTWSRGLRNGKRSVYLWNLSKKRKPSSVELSARIGHWTRGAGVDCLRWMPGPACQFRKESPLSAALLRPVSHCSK